MAAGRAESNFLGGERSRGSDEFLQLRQMAGRVSFTCLISLGCEPEKEVAAAQCLLPAPVTGGTTYPGSGLRPQRRAPFITATSTEKTAVSQRNATPGARNFEWIIRHLNGHGVKTEEECSSAST